MTTPGADQLLEQACTESALEADLGWALGSVFRAYLKSAHAAVEDIPGGPRGYQVLAAAREDAAASQQALGQRVGVDRSVMTYLVDDLVAAGLAERRPDPADRRARQVVLTDAGRTTLDRLDERIGLVEAHVLGGLSDADRDAFRTLLFRVAKRADALDPADSACGVVADVTTLTAAAGASATDPS